MLIKKSANLLFFRCNDNKRNKNYTKALTPKKKNFLTIILVAHRNFTGRLCIFHPLTLPDREEFIIFE